jgi:hypothetical protein
MDENDDAISLPQFAFVVDIPYSNLKKYMCEDLAKHRRLGVGSGRQPLLAPRDQDCIQNVMARKDRANDGANMQESVDLIQYLVPELSNMQARKHLARTLLNGDTNIVKSKPIVAQQTTTKRSNITVKQQYQWYKTYESSLNELRRRNLGVCLSTGKTFV